MHPEEDRFQSEDQADSAAHMACVGIANRLLQWILEASEPDPHKRDLTQVALVTRTGELDGKSGVFATVFIWIPAIVVGDVVEEAGETDKRERFAATWREAILDVVDAVLNDKC
jgi:hypothetical protein